MTDDEKRAQLVDSLSDQFESAVQEAIAMLVDRGHDPRTIRYSEQSSDEAFISALWVDSQPAATVTCNLAANDDTLHVSIEIMLIPIQDAADRGKAN